MKNHATRLLVTAGFILAFVAGAASRSLPGATGVTVVAAQEKHEAIADMRRAKDLLEQARGLLAGAPGTFGGHRDKALKHVEAAIGEVHEAVETREHEHH